MIINDVRWYPGMTMDQIEKKTIEICLSHFSGNKTMAAKSLSIGYKTFLKKIRDYGIESRNEESLDYQEGVLPSGKNNSL